ncbi:MAG: hypothetical protein QM704_09245 [Anaeromyxobacteraceae bacterium]
MIRSPRGYSLVELLISIAVAFVIIAGAIALLNGQMRSFQTGTQDRALQEAARIALSEISGNLRRAGYGVDPAVAFDFGDQAAARMEASPANFTFAVAGANCNAALALCRDRTDGPDEVSFITRDTIFGPHVVTQGYGGGTMKISGPLKQPLRAGQLLQVMCYSGTYRWAYVTLTAEAPATTADEVTLTIANGGTGFPNQAGVLGDACFSTVATVDSAATTYPKVATATFDAAAKVFKVDRYHYFIRNYSALGVEVPWGTAGSRPFLMLEQGLFGADGARIESVISPDVEDLQLAYVFPLATANRMVGTVANTAITADAAGIDLAATAPVFGDPEPTVDTPVTNKSSHHPGNIRAVQVSLVVRAPTPDIAIPGDDLPALGNRAATVNPGDNFKRLTVQTTVPVQNLAAEVPYYPTYDITGATALNAGGG